MMSECKDRRVWLPLPLHLFSFLAGSLFTSHMGNHHGPTMAPSPETDDSCELKHLQLIIET